LSPSERALTLCALFRGVICGTSVNDIFVYDGHVLFRRRDELSRGPAPLEVWETCPLEYARIPCQKGRCPPCPVSCLLRSLSPPKERHGLCLSIPASERRPSHRLSLCDRLSV
jgi:hypothetical protein